MGTQARQIDKEALSLAEKVVIPLSWGQERAPDLLMSIMKPSLVVKAYPWRISMKMSQLLDQKYLNSSCHLVDSGLRCKTVGVSMLHISKKQCGPSAILPPKSNHTRDQAIPAQKTPNHPIPPRIHFARPLKTSNHRVWAPSGAGTKFNVGVSDREQILPVTNNSKVLSQRPAWS